MFKFGGLVAISTPMLRKRINEINAMVRMEQIQGTKEFAASMKEAGTDTLGGFNISPPRPFAATDRRWSMAGWSTMFPPMC
jgi:hypothetical protein